MDDMVRDLYGHQAWADAEHWRALEAHEPALDDASIRERLHHIHIVQRALLAITSGEPIAPTKVEDFPTAAALKDYARSYHERAATFLDGLGGDRLATTISIPLLEERPVELTVAQALAHAAMHSQYHRGQIASRLRALGGEPAVTDFIVWCWMGRPVPNWD